MYQIPQKTFHALNPTETRIWLALRYLPQPAKWEEIAKFAGLSIPAVGVNLPSLEARGWFVKRRKAKNLGCTYEVFDEPRPVEFVEPKIKPKRNASKTGKPRGRKPSRKAVK